MTVDPTPVRKTPWLIIALGALAVLCVCAAIVGIAILAFLIPARVATTVTEPTPIIVFETATTVSTTPPAEETQASTNSVAPDAAPAGTAADIGNDMTLTVLEATRPVDDVVADGGSFNTTAPEGEEFIRVDVEVTCNADPGTACTFYPTVIRAVLSDGSTRDLQTFIEGVEDWDTAVETEGGATERGFLLFIVPNMETNILISYSDIYGAQPVYFQLP